MTIASEITRLQGAKADIKTAIEAKGVSIPFSDTIDCYACCIDSISTGSNVKFIDLLVVGGGGNGGGDDSYIGAGGGGGGGGGVIYKDKFVLSDNSYSIVVGYAGQNSCFGNCIAYAGGNGGGPAKYGYAYAFGCPGGNGGGGGGTSCGSSYSTRGGVSCPLQGTIGMHGTGYAGGGGGGATPCNDACCMANRYDGRDGFYTDISGTGRWYAGGGGGGTYGTTEATSKGGCGGGGCGMRCSSCGANNKNATYYGGGGGGGTRGNAGGSGFQGIVIVRYKTDGSYGINSATGGTKYTCGDYTIHCFVSKGTFCIVC